MSGLFADVAAMRRALDFHLRRHAVLSSNVANAETPGYKPSDISFETVLGAASELRATDTRHLRSDGASAGQRYHVFKDPSTPNANGNAVSLEREMAKIAANSLRYRAAAEMLNRRMALMRYAASDGQRR
ncbi:MAG: flagellar basal body rod protein FlgB [Myxococcales bacterium]|nr:flagellar basal body rod protein FlgB [Myxococcales bacterium]